ncbi:MAG: peptidylprolyl isomerase [Planctomycetota bacterium]|nr:peptidylprolyl isomerase [Planctomycetota bacterium]MCX8039085.1 peptidylprolyl isomerase [Planctomycetota bacterium]MDW8372195.1 peptidylprolyl isomerase [Planctomycetota bacterium]
MQIAKDTVARIHYRVSSLDGQCIDESAPGRPLSFLCGAGQIIVGLEEALVGKQAGDRVEVEVPPERAYGLRDPDLDLAVPIQAFPPELRGRLRAGMQFSAPHPRRQQEMVVFTIHGRRGDEILISGNHPLVGMALRFEVTVESVRAATAEELAHGHPHDEDCAH